ncbi:hypothetical protein H9Y05_12610 [Crocinitomicaceae bacterium CZZ-1]|uniref:Uncharacterized protein n=1 Tax=Taishania pollutisoli TaxID=2766479 RepID=A0A8J6TTM1_9FLAO|nr:hypothetical protein [Taishania pollutisoli]MBC9813312.1 hypothetical protein [Taishania pollutisoli]MBX2948919.1 hypothetical protein [Crocinitomicaceae bacterium]
MKKFFKVCYNILLYGFAIAGFGLIMSYMAIQFKWTNQKGSVDQNSRYLHDINEKYNGKSTAMHSSSEMEEKIAVFKRIELLNRFYPVNAEYIVHALEKGDTITEISRMLDAVDLVLKDDANYQKALKRLSNEQKTGSGRNKRTAFEWMNIDEWEIFKEAVAKDKHLIDSVAKVTGVEERLIVSCLVGEQIRLFNSNREAFKQWIGPLKILSVESQFSFGVTGIKEHTAQKIERLLKDPTSEFYLGQEYEHLLDFKTEDPATERISRLTSFRNHYYSYLYAAIFLKQVKLQWEKAGYPIEQRPEILATLFNVGFPQSNPNADPKVGGSTIKIHEVPYTFGMISYQFYYSGELYDLFPIRGKKFDWNKTGQVLNEL